MLAGRWDQATELLDGATGAGDAERAVLAVAAAEVAVDRDFWLRTDGGGPALERASAAVGSASRGTWARAPGRTWLEAAAAELLVPGS
jgi:hypothetical protein